jgi:hypothetical protein
MIVTNEAIDYHKVVDKLVYETLTTAAQICQIRAFAPDGPDPNLLDSIASGIHRFLADGDIFDQVIETLIERDPEYFGRRLAAQDEAVAKTVIAVVLGES